MGVVRERKPREILKGAVSSELAMMEAANVQTEGQGGRQVVEAERWRLGRAKAASETEGEQCRIVGRDVREYSGRKQRWKRRRREACRPPL